MKKSLIFNMKKTTLIFLITHSIYSFSQNLYLTKRDYNNSSNYIHSLQKLSAIDGSVISNSDYSTFFPNSYSPRSLTFNNQTNEIIGISGNIITKKNVITNNETSYFLPNISSINYYGLIIANNRLFLTKTDNSTTPETNYIEEINQSNGEVIISHVITSNIPSYNRDLIYSNSTNEIFGLSGNIIYKYNIINNIESTYTLPAIANLEYDDIVIAENRLFVTTRDYSVSPNIISIRELNLLNCEIINTYNFNTNLQTYIDSLTFLADTHEICGISRLYLDGSFHYKIIKYNILNNIETSFDLPLQNSVDYDEIISTLNEQNLGLSNFNQNSKFRVVKYFNLIGQELPVETKNQIIILKYENGEVEKIYYRN